MWEEKKTVNSAQQPFFLYCTSNILIIGLINYRENMALGIKQFINIAGIVKDLKSFNFRYVKEVFLL